MRDPIVERIVQPVVNRHGADPENLAGLCATLYAAVAITDSTMTVSRGNGSIGSLLFVAISMFVTNMLWRNRSTHGAVGPIALAHFVGRSFMLAIGLSSLSQTAIALAIVGSRLAGPHHDPRLIYGDICNAAEPILIALSMYFAACDKPPPRRRRAPAKAEATA